MAGVWHTFRVNIVQITPGAGKMFCGGCLRDNALVAALRKQGHTVTMVPLYLPITLDEENQSVGTPIFFSGINVYLEQKFTLYQSAPDWLRNLLASPKLLELAAGSAAKTRPEDVGDLMISMLKGEEGNQARELEELIAWLKEHENPSVISLSDALLVGFARNMKRELGVSIVCSLQGEDFFLDSLPEPIRSEAWKVLAERAADVDLFISPSRYFAEVMGKRMGVPMEKMRVMANGIALEGYDDESIPKMALTNQTLGFFARMCPEKGLGVLVDAFILLRQRGKVEGLKLKVGGSCGPADEKFVLEQREKLRAAKLLEEVSFHPNLSRSDKVAFLKSLSLFSVPAVYSEAFGLYLIEALAAGVPIVQPRHAAFPEIVEATGGGVLCAHNAEALAQAMEVLLLDDERRRALGIVGRAKVMEKFSSEKMASAFTEIITRLQKSSASASV